MLANPDIALALSARRGMRGRASLRPPRTISPVAELGNSAVTRKDFNFRTIHYTKRPSRRLGKHGTLCERT